MNESQRQTNAPVDEVFERFTAPFRVHPCSNVSAGVIGSIFYLDFGKMIPLRASLKDVNLKDEECTQHGEFGVEANNAAWRIDDVMQDRVLATSNDDNSENGPIVASLMKLIGAKVVSASVKRPGMDCTLTFDNGLRLELFPVGARGSSYNYAFRAGRSYYTVGEYSSVKIE